MKVIAAYLLAVMGGNNSPSAEDIKKILGSVGAEADDDKIGLLLSKVAGRDVAELIAAGMEKLASVSAAGAAAVAVAPSAAAAAPAAESKKEEKVEDVEESDDEMCLSLFD